MEPITEAHRRLGQALRRVRKAAALTTHQVPSPQGDGQYMNDGHVSLYERGMKAPSSELVEIYINMAGTDDAAELRYLYKLMQVAAEDKRQRQRLGGVQAPETVPPRRADDVSSREQVQRHYVTAVNDTTYLFNGAGALEQVDCAVTIRALRPDVYLYYTGFNYIADQRQGVLRAEAGSGASLCRVQEGETGALRLYFLLKDPLSPDDEPYTINFRILVSSSERAWPRLTYHGGPDTGRLVVRACFQALSLPQRIWRFGAADAVDAEHCRPGSELLPGPDGCYAGTFDHLLPEWRYGIAWVW